MTKVTTLEVQKLASLAKLTLKTAEIKKITQELGSVLTYVGEIQKVDTSHIKSKLWQSEPQNVSRQDATDDFQKLTPDEAVSNARQVKNNLFVVPGLLNKEDI